jgi:hypothetical protein
VKPLPVSLGFRAHWHPSRHGVTGTGRRRPGPGQPEPEARAWRRASLLVSLPVSDSGESRCSSQALTRPGGAGRGQPEPERPSRGGLQVTLAFKLTRDSGSARRVGSRLSQAAGNPTGGRVTEP